MRVEEALKLGHTTLALTSDAPDVDTTQLLLHVLRQTESTWLITHPEHDLTPAKLSVFESLLNERATGKPLAYILGHQEFLGREFIVTPDVLIPRPATENLVQSALLAIKELVASKKRPLLIADIGTGSGCVAVSLALLTSPAEVDHIYATDISQAALAIAEQNIDKYKVSDRVSTHVGSLLTPLSRPLYPKDLALDLIISNPPYVPTAELDKSLAESTPETAGLAFEPRQALDGGTDGQQYIKALQDTGLPLVVEGLSGQITRYNF